MDPLQARVLSEARLRRHGGAPRLSPRPRSRAAPQAPPPVTARRRRAAQTATRPSQVPRRSLRRRLRLAACLATFPLSTTSAALAQSRDADTPTHADSVRGADNPSRAWWDVTFYDLHVWVNPADSSMVGWNGITYRVQRPGQTMQLDLQ